MPQTSGSDNSISALRQLRVLAQTTLNNLRSDIRDREAGLIRLKAEEEMLFNFVSTEPHGTHAASDGHYIRDGRTKWREVLNRLPKRFKISDVEQLNGLKGKSPDISAAITRWINAGLVKRTARGLYERV